jgi:hypothetical protein
MTAEKKYALTEVRAYFFYSLHFKEQGDEDAFAIIREKAVPGETAIVLPLILLLLMGIIDFGLLLTTILLYRMHPRSCAERSWAAVTTISVSCEKPYRHA